MTQPGAATGGGIARWSVAKPVTVGMLFAGLIVLGALAYARIPVQLLPTGYELPFLYVSVPTLPSNPSDVEDQVALPVEELLSTARGISRLRTRARSAEATFLIEFEDGTDMIEAYQQVKDRLERALPLLPSDVERYFIWKYNPNDQPIYWFGVSLTDDAPIRDRYADLKRALIQPLERVDGVSRVDIWGEAQQLVRVELDEAKVAAAGLSTYEVIERLRADNFLVSAGHVTDGGQKVAVRVLSRFDDLDTLRALPIAPGWPLGALTRQLAVDFEEATAYNRINGREAIMIGVYKDADANTVEVCDAVRALISAQFTAEPTLAAFNQHHFRSHGDMINLAIADLQQTAIWGGVFAVLVLLLFIRDVPMTLLIAVGIPLAMLITLVVMFFTGFTLNMLTLMGLMLSVGMVVDNAIVVVENIQRLRAEAPSPEAGDPLTARAQAAALARAAAVRGTAEVALALFVATATTVIVFLPMILMSGNQTLSFYLGKIGFPVCISLVASLLTSLIFIPVACVKLPHAAPKPTPRWMRALERSYRHTLRWVIRRRFDAAVFFVAVAATVTIPMGKVQRTDQLAGNLGDVNIRFDIEPQVTLAEREAYFRDVEAALLPARDRLGIDSVRVRVARDRDSKVQLFMKPPAEAPHAPPRDALNDALTQLIPKRPGISPKISTQQGLRRGGGGGASADASLTLQLRGPDTRRLQALSEEVARRLRLLPEVQAVEVSQDDTGADELHVFIERDLAQRVGLSAAVIGGAIDYALRGRRLSDLHQHSQRLTLRVEGDPNIKRSRDKLRQVRLPAALGGGALVPLALVTSDATARGPGSIHRETRQTVLDIAVQTKTEDLDTLAKKIDAAMSGFALPRGYVLDKGARFTQLKRNEEAQSFALALAVVFVFLLMGVLFESALMPLAIICAIPFAILGVYWALYLTQTPLDVMAGVGLIILVGVVVNNGIVLVDVINQRRAEGAPLEDALIDGCGQRLRPVLMTALTTIFGLIPMATGDSGIAGIPYAPLGITVIGGLLTSTLLTLFVVPYLYISLTPALVALSPPPPSLP